MNDNHAHEGGVIAIRDTPLLYRKPNRGAVKRWGPDLGSRYNPVSSYYLEAYHRIPFIKRRRKIEGVWQDVKEPPGLKTVEAMLPIHITDFMWFDEAFPSVKSLADRMNLSPRMVQNHLLTLELSGLMSREQRDGHKSNSYSFLGLILRLERMRQDDEREKKSNHTHRRGA